MNLTHFLRQKTVPVFSLIIGLVVLVTFLAYWVVSSLQSASSQDEELGDLIEEDKAKTLSWFAAITGVVSLFGIGLFIAHLVLTSPKSHTFTSAEVQVFSLASDGRESEEMSDYSGNVRVCNAWECIQVEYGAGSKTTTYVQTGPHRREFKPCIRVSHGKPLYNLISLKLERLQFGTKLSKLYTINCYEKFQQEIKLPEGNSVASKELRVLHPNGHLQQLYCVPFWEFQGKDEAGEIEPDDKMMITLYKWLYRNMRSTLGSNYYLSRVDNGIIQQGGMEPPTFKIVKLPLFAHHDDGTPISESEAIALQPVADTFARLTEIISHYI